jgi:magnesium transporter
VLTAFELQDQRLCQIDTDKITTRLSGAAWVDLVDPTDEERTLVESIYRQQLPDPEEVEEIEATARFFEDENGLHIHSLFLHELHNRAHTSTVAFTLNPGRLITFHDHDIPVFRLLRLRARREAGLVSDPVSILLALFETKVEDLADTLEQVYTGLEEVSRLVLEDNETDLEGIIDDLARHEDANGKVRLCLMDTQRALSYLLRKGILKPDHAEHVREILRDVDSLLPHSAFLFEKVNFLMDATQNFINIEQNQIIKIFSVAAVVFLPPTLIASIYGMNFRHLPELDLTFGYPLAIIMMILSGVAPYWYFKRKGWL